MRRAQHRQEAATEFELDLAPLLSVMVKLVPVLLISSAFVQFSVIETDLPQAVKEAVQQNNEPEAVAASLYLDKQGFRFVLKKGSDVIQDETVPLQEGAPNWQAVYEKGLEIKTKNPSLFHLNFNPSADVAYNDVAKTMDKLNRARGGEVFNWTDKEGKSQSSSFMFPDIVLANINEGGK